MKIVLLCATHRGYLVLEKLAQIAQGNEILVLSFKEESWEPPFFNGIRDLAHSYGFQFIEARQVGSKNFDYLWESFPFDIMLMVSWRYYVPPSIYMRAKIGAFIIHDSLLPCYRGFSPTVWSIINGEDHTGATLFEIAEEIDAGFIIVQKRVSIDELETIHDVMEKVTQKYLEILEEYLPKLLANDYPKHPQDHSKATFTCKRLPDDNLIDWSQSSEKIYNLIRATTYPYPGAFTYLGGRLLRIWSAEKVSLPEYVGRIPGRVIEIRRQKGVVVLTGTGGLLLASVQFENEEKQLASNIITSITMTLGR